MLGGAQYYTLVAELAELTPDAAFDPASREKIVSELSAPDRRAVSLLDEWDEIARVEDVAGQRARFEGYYARVESEGGIFDGAGAGFVRDWLMFDRRLRTQIAKGEWPQGLEKITDIVERERALDRLRWAHLDELQGFDTFGAPTVLGYLVKLAIVGRWARLSPAAGREMYDKLVNGLKDREI